MKQLRMAVAVLAAVFLASCSVAGGNDGSRAAFAVDPDFKPIVDILQPVDNTDLATVNGCNRKLGSGVIISFDDQGSADDIKAILDELDELNWRAAFFPTGEWALDNWGIIQEIQRRGHIVGSHTMTHQDLVKVLKGKDGESKFFGEVYPLENGATTSPMLLRPPYGSGLDDPKVTEYLSEKNVQLCGWTADTNDWRGGSAKTMLKRVMEGYKYSDALQPDGVVLAHMGGDNSVEFIRLLAEELDERGWSRESLEK